ncbi:MAG TPA: serine/threonine-protein kinase, partial [Candidatus Eisenbacteria bacterium]|nr:serine/threonine-protein kinase [Candidatus Eisenbacteria bacterium]
MTAPFAGRFHLLQPLGRGGMGEVFLARDAATGLVCALKRLKPAPGDPHTVLREFEALTRVRHPAVVAVHEMGFAPDGTPWITMEYLPGIPADRAVARGDWRMAVRVAARVAHGLEALHAARVVHGDLKPSNLMVIPAAGSSPLQAKLVDFGLAALLDRDRRGFRGTPGYAAPEVARGAAQAVSTDLYGLGATLYQLVTGRAPFEGADASSRLRRQLEGPPPTLPLEEAGAPPALVTLVMRAMAAEPAERPR